MMWNKLLLTEFVIYLCRLVGLMLLVFEFYRLFFQNFPFFCIVCWCALNLAVWKGQVDDQISTFGRITTKKTPFRVRIIVTLQVSQQMQFIKNNPRSAPASLCYFKRRCRFGLTDVTGCNSAKSPLHWWIMTPWLGSSELLFGRFCSMVEDYVREGVLRESKY